MSPRAAWRLEALAFSDVYDYVAGKSDWLAAGLPTEGPGSATPRPGALARPPVATCGPRQTLDRARRAVEASDGDRCVVVNDAGVVLGVVGINELANVDRTVVEDVMQIGPTTVRAHEDLAGLLHRMHARRVASVLVTDPDGRLIGVLARDDGDAALPGHTWETERQTQ